MSHAKFWKKNTNVITNILESLHKQDTSNKKGTSIDNFSQ